MSLLQKIRNWSGIKSVDVTDEQPIDLFEKAHSELADLEGQLKKAQDEFTETSSSLELKIEACNKLIEKGSEEGEYNRGVLEKRLDTISNEFLDTVGGLTKAIDETKEKRDSLEHEILEKSIELTAMLSDEERGHIKDTMVLWGSSGLIKGEQVDNQLRAIVKAIDLVVLQDLEKGGEGSKGGHVIGHTKSGKAIYDSFDHPKHKDFTADDHRDAGHIERSPYQQGIFRDNRDSVVNERHAHNSNQSDKHLKEAAAYDKKIEKAESLDGHYANVIVRSGDKILFLKRGKDKKLAPGQWCLPGGHIDAGESITQAGVRELKEEANIDCDAHCLYVSSKAKGNDGKWSFYLNGCYPHTDSVALLDGESANAAWMTKEQWMDADLFFDLKDHLIAMEYPDFNIDGVPTIKKAEEADFFFEQLEKAGTGAALPIGTVHTWGGVKYQKISESKWKPLKKNHKLSIADVTAHAENTSSSQLKKVASDHPDPHLRDAAKREGERRKAEKEKNTEKPVEKKKPVKLKALTADIKSKSLSELAKKHPEVYGKDLDHFYKHAASQNDKFQSFAKDLSDLVGGELVMGPVKKLDRVKPKVEKDFGGDYSKLNDVLRCTIMMKSSDHVIKGMKKFFQQHNKKIQKFYFDFESEGYNGGNVVLRMPDGVPVEIQFNTPINMALKDNVVEHPLIEKEREKIKDHGIIAGMGHKFYEQIQEMDRLGEEETPENKGKKEKLTKWMNKYYGFRDYFSATILLYFTLI